MADTTVPHDPRSSFPPREGKAASSASKGCDWQNPSLWALGGLWALSLFGAFAASAPVQTLYGVAFAGLGLLMFFFPPRARLPWFFYALAGLLLAQAALSFLPREWFPAQPWRLEVEALGVDTGGQVTPHPRQSIEFWLRLAVWLGAALFALGHRVEGGSRLLLALLFSVGVAVYAGVSMAAESFQWKLTWDPVPTFGFFLNRNHTATFLVMGALCGLGVMRQAIREKRGGMAGAAALSLAVCLAALMGYSSSRAGIVLLGVGGLAWVLGLGGRYVSRGALVALLVFGGLAAAVFLTSDNAVKTRLFQTAEKLGLAQSAESEASVPVEMGQGAGEEVPFDLRVPVHQDTWTMIRSEPWTGVGLGAFQYVFPQYRRRSANDGWAVHPESDWLQLAAEGGWPALALLGGATILALVLAFRLAWKQRAWALRWGCLLAAAVVPAHSLFDVPAYTAAMGWGAFFLLGLVLPEPVKPPPSCLAGWCFSGVGLLVSMAGVFLLRAELFGGPQCAYAGAQQLYRHADFVYRTSERTLARAEASTPEERSAMDQEIHEARTAAEEARKALPLLGWLYGLQGGLDLLGPTPHDEDSISRDFAIQRQLNPLALRLLFWQAERWKKENPAQLPPLWREAMKVAYTLEKESVASQRMRQQRRDAFESIMRQARGDDFLQDAALDIVRTEGPLLQRWVQLAPSLRLDHHMPRLLTSAALDDPTKRELFQTWAVRGKRDLVRQFAQDNPLFQNLMP